MSTDDDCELATEVRLSVARALWGVPTPELRAVAVGWDDEVIRLLFFYDKPVTDFESDLVGACGGEVIADFPAHRIDEEAVHLPAPGRLELGELKEWAYMRHEP